jgi:hypothetical protein
MNYVKATAPPVWCGRCVFVGLVILAALIVGLYASFFFGYGAILGAQSSMWPPYVALDAVFALAPTVAAALVWRRDTRSGIGGSRRVRRTATGSLIASFGVLSCIPLLLVLGVLLHSVAGVPL